MSDHYETTPEAGVLAAYGNGWRQMWKNFLMLILIAIVYLVVSAPVGLSSAMSELGGHLINKGDGAALVGGPIAAMGFLLSFFYGIFIMAPVKYGVSYVYLKAARNNRLDITDLFEAFRNYLSAVLASLLVGLLTFIGVLFFIIPGIVIACKLAFTPYLVVDRRMGVIEAVQESWDMTHGHALQVFGIALLGFPIGILGLMCLGIGIIPAAMWIQMAYASLYHAVCIDDEIDASMYA